MRSQAAAVHVLLKKARKSTVSFSTMDDDTQPWDVMQYGSGLDPNQDRHVHCTHSFLLMFFGLPFQDSQVPLTKRASSSNESEAGLHVDCRG